MYVYNIPCMYIIYLCMYVYNIPCMYVYNKNLCLEQTGVASLAINTSKSYIFCGTGERNRGYALLMTANKPETALYRAPTFSLLLASHGGLVHMYCTKSSHDYTAPNINPDRIRIGSIRIGCGYVTSTLQTVLR